MTTGPEHPAARDDDAAETARTRFERAVEQLPVGDANRLRLSRRELLASNRSNSPSWLLPTAALAAGVLAIGLAWRQPAFEPPGMSADMPEEPAPPTLADEEDAMVYAWLAEAPVATSTERL